MHLTFTWIWNNYWLTIVTTNKKKNVWLLQPFSSCNIHRKKAKLPYLCYISIVIILYRYIFWSHFGVVSTVHLCAPREKTNNRCTPTQRNAWKLEILFEINSINLKKNHKSSAIFWKNIQKARTKISTATAITYYQDITVTACGTVKWKFPRWIYD